ncbi:NUDIX domain-containing protein [Brachybacterium saurashtrense]|uniref:NUDIX domain-containing protein n=1 Tax=Brachybacterium saurashtrense TaxID=556288 RepID=A0A345YM87_9MICO|nr:NUDIX domain-containing protein [Brachybacterium saurashtrense]AXK45039.1 NUDIX domain-containing protein [Brachybacterium saurashtrense]RRR21723.1 NUDIX domain-containing protein [Brachybacterium saurashtrense]
MTTRRGRALGAVLTAGHRLRRFWWRVRTPRTYGVKVLLRHPERPELFLAVRHSYVDQDRWALPGGRYRPARETPASAARREVREELGLAIRGELAELSTLEARTEGKRDTLTLLSGSADGFEVRTSLELREVRWLRIDLADVPDGDRVSRWLRLALERDVDRADDGASGPT